MQVLIDFISGIGDIFVAVINFFVNLVMDIVFIVQLAVQAVGAIRGYLDWLPIPILGMVAVGITVIFIYKIAGR